MIYILPRYKFVMDEIDRAYLRHIRKGKRNPNWKGGKSLCRNPYCAAGWMGFGENNPMWKGGRTINREGYVMIKDWSHPRRHSNGYVFEHIIVLEKKLGRPLDKKNEVTHHINGNHADNRPENLEVMNRAHHITHHHLGVSYAKERRENMICTVCGRTHTKINKKRDGTPYPLWLYVEGHKHDKDYAMCQTCWTRYHRARKKEVV